MKNLVMKTKKLLVNLKKINKINWIDEFVALRSTTYSFISNGENTNKIKGIRKSYSKNIKFEEYKNCLDGEKNQEESGKIFWDLLIMRCIFKM